MIVNENEYNWSEWTQPIFTSNDSWGIVSASSINAGGHEPFTALDGNLNTQWESKANEVPTIFAWTFEKPLKITQIKLTNKKSGGAYLSSTVKLYADTEKTTLLKSDTFDKSTQSIVTMTFDKAVCLDMIVLELGTYSKHSGLSEIAITAEVGELIPVNEHNYNSVEELFAAGITNMDVIRNNSKQDDGEDTVTGVDWFKFNNIIASSIYASGNTWFGFGSSSEQLKVNRRDTSSYYVYREEGTLFGVYKFLKIRWSGYSYYSNTSDSCKLTYDVVLWDSGNISLHMVDIPTDYYNGTFELVAASTLTYTAPTKDSPDVTFFTQNENNTVYTAENALISIEPPYTRKYMVRAQGTLYTVSDGVLTALGTSAVTAELFRTQGADEVPTTALLNGLVDPEILYFADTTEYKIVPLTAVQKATPLTQTVETPDYDMSHSSIFGIKSVVVDAGSSIRFAVSFDSGSTWLEYNGTDWVETADGMTALDVNAISAEAWNSVATTGKFRFRAVIPDKDNHVKSLIVNYINE